MSNVSFTMLPDVVQSFLAAAHMSAKIAHIVPREDLTNGNSVIGVNGHIIQTVACGAHEWTFTYGAAAHPRPVFRKVTIADTPTLVTLENFDRVCPNVTACVQNGELHLTMDAAVA